MLYSRLFFSIRQDGVFIICSLLVFYLLCLLFDIANKEVSDKAIPGLVFACIIMLFHVVALIVVFLISLWQWEFSWNVVFTGQVGASTLMLFFIPVFPFYYYGEK
ncbi:hypothetical protein [Gibbsiella quercinecans]|uniref:hypothetical protein n=1 Tax=Gibbsiella quercinecans TaxID=929813 RepID=UPI0011C3765E|nr:hypothetical protein [Gibbsiella quercinecans]